MNKNLLKYGYIIGPLRISGLHQSQKPGTVVYLVHGIMKATHEVNLPNDVLTKCVEFKQKETAKRRGRMGLK